MGLHRELESHWEGFLEEDILMPASERDLQRLGRLPGATGQDQDILPEASMWEAGQDGVLVVMGEVVRGISG